MTYGQWIDRGCVCQADVDYYRNEWRGMQQLARDYLDVFQEPDFRWKLHGFQFPDWPRLSRVTTHRRIIERLYQMADFLARLEYLAGMTAETGEMAGKIWRRELAFIPPTERRM